MPSCKERFLAIFPRRLQVIFMLFLGLLIIFGMRTEIGLALLKMNQNLLNVTFFIPAHNDSSSAVKEYLLKEHLVPNHARIKSLITIRHGGSIEARVTFQTIRWSSLMIGFIEAGFFMGYLVCSIPSGVIANLTSGHRLLGIVWMIICALNMLIPLVAIGGEDRQGRLLEDGHPNISFALIFIIRILQGMGESVVYPCVHEMLRWWAPQNEKARLVSLCFFGVFSGPIFGYPLSGLLIWRHGWESPFYFFGAIGLFWGIVWLATISAKPSKDCFITEEEKTFIREPAEKRTQNICDIPWRSIFTSLPVWAIVAANFARNWLYQFTFTGLPQFLNDVQKHEQRLAHNASTATGLTPAELGNYMLIPYACMAFLTLIGGVVSDLVISKNLLNVGHTRKLINTLGYGITLSCLTILCLIHSFVATLILLSLALGCIGFGTSAYAVNQLDIAPAYAGIIMGISNGIATFAGVFSTMIAQRLVHHGSRAIQGWIHFLILTIAIQLFCLLIFLIFASGEQQQWAKVPTEIQVEELEPAPLTTDPKKME
ncbi:hypothetical protein Ciccas_010255 [Cichlidogyrus casuarinus]|uniref:Major facilitator superfamily (MFS) profile domain-containing protein n=1 Tax=Cichlidogyrus casuarinus TaxID=1844966 RepID=A0ABD2PW92_9PLAT